MSMWLLAAALLVASPTPTPPEQEWSKVVVDLSDQEAVIYNSAGRPLVSFDVSTGAADTPTPLGRFKVSSKTPVTFSRSNPDITMRYMVRFKNGVGFHAIPRQNGIPLNTPLGVSGVSHGCVRLADKDARLLYKNLPLGATVVVRP